ncbi:hypothetical protein ACPF3V_003415 [Vibrio cholerae]|uniref:hypothetical protein n=1 Tax=Vibrio TaxID=662 RepID=UPI00028D5349|nr:MULTISPECIES: hypothetical protein [Vibrio]AOY48553.1 hypothetical protein NH62_22366 [Vibrio cholerae]AOY52203.1 hypothetical protein AP033_22408 [Vibrio cholerae]EHS4947858.1 hypothetical protein [Vibrio cholerae]EKG73731.1 hypothetical protein VCCP103710_0243 [Vibrio cholerae CP1037(10)]NOF01923.1 hypothetical protein [Vibrio cholerae]
MGGETKNIDEIAGIISSRIFDELRWTSGKTNDISWDCCMRSHLTEAQLNAKTPTQKKHPTDVVFSYQDPYTDVVQYVQTDLKSYSKATLEKYGAILKTIRSLSQQVECASRSPKWKEMFLIDKERSFVVHGMLFIYNHDNEYDKDLYQKIAGAATSEYSLPEDSMIAVFDPKLIRFLLDVTENIEKRRAYTDKVSQQENVLWQKIPDYDKCSFFYPDKHNKIATKGKSLPATIEMITSGLLFYSYEHDFIRDDNGQRLQNRVLNIFWQEEVDSESHFIFILEYIFNYQLLNQFDRIFIITPFSSTSGNYLDEAIKTYAAMYSFTLSQLDTLKDKVKSIPFVNQKLSIFEYQVASKQVERGLCHFS